MAETVCIYPTHQEADASTQEHQQTRIEELAADLDRSFKQMSAYRIQTGNETNTRFEKSKKAVAEIRATMGMKEKLATVKEELKNDMAALDS